ncbi:MAG: patatin-like phospholipase family protein [Deltaproteobacteria bacterium]|nr:patatin-like phospholipase family protein [Deltaproteobacteria bacterium]
MRILSFDGASAAALQIRLLHDFERRCPGLLRSVDVFAGTSDGAFMALYLAIHATDDDDENLKVLERAVQFSNGMIPLFRVNLCNALRLVTGVRAMLLEKEFREYLQKHYGDMTLAGLKRKVVILSFDAFNWVPRTYSNLRVPFVPDPHFIFAPPDDPISLVDVGLASSALPMVLPLLRHGPRTSADGGVVANNPTMAAVSRACQSMLTAPGQRARDQLSNLRVLSLGARVCPEEHFGIITGLGRPTLPSSKSLDWGWIEWILLRPMLLGELTFQGSMEMIHYEADCLLTDAQYHRINPMMHEIQAVFALAFKPAKVLIKQLDKEAARLFKDPLFVESNVLWIKTHFVPPLPPIPLPIPLPE